MHRLVRAMAVSFARLMRGAAWSALGDFAVKSSVAAWGVVAWSSVFRLELFALSLFAPCLRAATKSGAALNSVFARLVFAVKSRAIHLREEALPGGAGRSSVSARLASAVKSRATRLRHVALPGGTRAIHLREEALPDGTGRSSVSARLASAVKSRAIHLREEALPGGAGRSSVSARLASAVKSRATRLRQVALLGRTRPSSVFARLASAVKSPTPRLCSAAARLARPGARATRAWLTAVALISAGPAFAATPFLVAIGADVGDADDAPLRFAALDAQRVTSVFVELGGVRAENATLLANLSAPQVRAALARVERDVTAARARGDDPLLLLYVSAHAQLGLLHLGATTLPLAELRAWAEHTQARLQVLIVDSCQSGMLIRQKGGMAGAEYEVDFERTPLAGQVVLMSSGPAEPSQEWASLGGSLFTHHLLAGLRGEADVDGDGAVTLGEAYGYAYRRTLVNAANSGQHPTFDFDVSGTGELTLTAPARAHTALVFDAKASGRYVVSSQPAPTVVVEVDKNVGREARLALPPGRYLVKKRLGGETGVMEVLLSDGITAKVDEAALSRRPAAEVALKGEAFEVRESTLSALGSFETETMVASGGRWRAGAGYRKTAGLFWFGVALSAGFTSFRGVDLRVDEVAVAPSVAGGVRWHTGPLVVRVGPLVELPWVSQRATRDQELEIDRVFNRGPLAPRQALGVSFGPHFAVDWRLATRLVVSASADALVRALAVAEQPTWSFGLRGGLAVGVLF